MAPVEGELARREVVGALLADRGGLLVVSGLGAPTWDCTAAGDSDLTFPMWGGMGGAAMVGLGLALARPDRRVLVVTGDGEMLMGLGALATIAVQRPANLGIAVLDNERYGETGMQESHTAAGVDLAAVAVGAGFAAAVTAWDAASLREAVQLVREAPGPALGVFKVAATRAPLVMPPRDGAHLVARFREALLGPESHAE